MTHRKSTPTLADNPWMLEMLGLAFVITFSTAILLGLWASTATGQLGVSEPPACTQG